MRNTRSLSKEEMTDEEWEMFCHQMDMENSPSICSACGSWYDEICSCKICDQCDRPYLSCDHQSDFE